EAQVAWNPAELLRTLDTLVAELPDRNEEILMVRLGGESGEMPTLEEIGAKFRLTRERIRQIVARSVERIRKAGRRRLKSYLEHTQKLCCETVCPLTPALLEHWVEESPGSGRFDFAFYVHLLAELSPTIPAWPAGQ